MEGDVSKHGSTESVVSSTSHQVSPSDHLFDLGIQINDCLNISNTILNQHHHLANQIAAYNLQIQLLQAQSRAKKLQTGFQKSTLSGIVDHEGYFAKREYCPIIIKQSN